MEFKSKNSALKTVSELNDKEFRGRKIVVALAVDQRLYQDVKDKEKKEKEGHENGNTADSNGLVEEEKEDENEETGHEEKQDDEAEGSKADTKAPFANPNKDKGVVFVKNINFDVNADDFTDHFKAFDKIAWAKVR